MNKSDLEKMQKAQEKYNKFFEDTSFQRKIDKIARDIRNRQDNAMAMEFTRTIAELLRENGIVVNCTERSYTKDMTDKSIECAYGVVFDSVDCSEHDKKFKDEIAQLKHDLEEAEQRTNELEEIYKRERKVIDNLYCRCSKRAETTFKDRQYECLRIITIDELKSYEEHRKEQEIRIKELENIIKRHNFKSTKDILNENIDLKKQVAELEMELDVKDNLLKIKNGLCGEEIPKEITIDGFKCEIIQTAQGLYIERDRIYEIIEQEKEPIKKKCAELEDRHQSDCITINQLHTALDVMTEKYQRLREMHGL